MLQTMRLIMRLMQLHPQQPHHHPLRQTMPPRNILPRRHPQPCQPDPLIPPHIHQLLPRHPPHHPRHRRHRSPQPLRNRQPPQLIRQLRNRRRLIILP